MAPSANASDSTPVPTDEPVPTPVPTDEPVPGTSDDSSPSGGVVLDEYPSPCIAIAQNVTAVQQGVIAMRLATGGARASVGA